MLYHPIPILFFPGDFVQSHALFVTRDQFKYFTVYQPWVKFSEYFEKKSNARDDSLNFILVM